MLGMRRSGNHAIMNWILLQLKGSKVVLDNMQEHQPLATPNKRLKPGFGKVNLLVSHEDRELNDFFLTYNEEQFGKAKNKFSLLILRDPYNWLASWYAWQDELGIRFRNDKAFRDHTINLWKDYARLYLKWQTEESKGSRQEIRISINYNQWVKSMEYRKALAQTLLINFTDKGRNKMSINGHGSSFDGMAFNGRASELNVLERWKQFESDPEFRALFDDEIKNLAQQIFPEVKASL